ncbi:hypothetical protein [Streptomyces sp. 4N124]|uniref:hypothetical protein n=1 Tax=Streptomyces sp. 4N124 TaxID=3457420 RepID=UPI003FD466C8
MAEMEHNEADTRSFLSCATEVARLLNLGNTVGVPEAGRARHLAQAARKPLLERATLPEEFFAPLMAAAVCDPDPSFCRWFVERARYCAHVPLRADRSPAYAPGGSRDPDMDESRDVMDEWGETLRQSAMYPGGPEA